MKTKTLLILFILLVLVTAFVIYKDIFQADLVEGVEVEEDMEEDVEEVDESEEDVEEMENKEAVKELVVLETSKGSIEIELDRSKSPITVENFLSYVQEGFYDGTIFHRVIPGFMVQGGGFLPDGSEKPVKAPIVLESNNGLKNTVGTLAMARTNDLNSATSQFFFNTVDNGFLDYAPGNDGYAVFGKVVSGMEVVKEIEAVATGAKGPHQDWPVNDVLIEKAYVK